MRKTIYVSERRNKPIADFINGLAKSDVSFEVVKLMEDGMKWRGDGNAVDKATMEEGSNVSVLLPKAETPVSEKSAKADFSGIELKRRKPEKSELDRKFNKL